MSQLLICDVCQCPIKPNDKKFAMSVQELTEEEGRGMDAFEYLQNLQRKYKQMEIKEICQTCKKICDRFFQLRKDEIAKLNEEIEKSYQEPKLLENKNNTVEYCNCSDPEAYWDNLKWGETLLRCKICGKIINLYETEPNSCWY